MRKKRSPSVPQRLAALAKIYEERGKVYAKDYQHLGASLKAIFPQGLLLETEEEFNRFALFIHLHGKMARYGQNIKKGGHADSLDDASVYAQLMRECDDDGIGLAGARSK